MYKMNSVVAEFLGTLLFLIVVIKKNDPISIALGLLMALYVFGDVSGHFNPAISVMKAFQGQLEPSNVAMMVGGQLAAAYVAPKVVAMMY